jgi:ribonuclease HI
MSTSEFRGLVYIHADESCLGNQFSERSNPGGAAGLIEVFDEKRGWIRRDYYFSEPDTTNQRMALRSAIEGLNALSRPCRIVFHSDSNYLVRGMSEWVHNWAGRGWKRKGGPIENLDLWIELVEAAARHYSAGHGIEWRWVRGHAGHPKNEYANKLAIQAARNQKSSGGPVDSGFSAWLEAQQELGRFPDFLDLPPDQPFRPDPPPPRPPPGHQKR